MRLRTCVAELCGVQRAVVMLRLLDEQSGEDVAATLGLSRGHVDVLVHRAKAALRVCMREPDGDGRVACSEARLSMPVYDAAAPRARSSLGVRPVQRRNARTNGRSSE